MRSKRKAYRPKPVRTPSILYDVTVPPITPEEIALLQSVAEESLARIQLGSKNEDDFRCVFSALDHAYVLSVVFHERYELQLLALLAKGALLAVVVDHPDAREHLTLLTRPAQTCLDSFFDAQKTCERSLLVKSHRYAMEHPGICRVDPEALWYIDPTDGACDTTRPLFGVRGAVFLDGYVRTGYLEETEDGNMRWISPLEDFKPYPVTEPALVLVADSVRRNHDAQKAVRDSRS